MNFIKNNLLKILMVFLLLFLFAPKNVLADNTTKLPAPVNLAAQVIGTGDTNVSVRLAWNLPIPSDDAGPMPNIVDYGFLVEREYTEFGQTYRMPVVDLEPTAEGITDITTGGSYEDRDLAIGDNYTYYVTTYDRDGNKSDPASVQIAVQIQDDNGCVNDINQNVDVDDSNNVSILWDFVCNATYYKIYRDNNFIQQVDSPYVFDESVSAGTHAYKIEAYSGDETSFNSLFLPVAKAASNGKLVASKTFGADVLVNSSNNSNSTNKINKINWQWFLLILPIVLISLFCFKKMKKQRS